MQDEIIASHMFWFAGLPVTCFGGHVDVNC